MVGLISTWLPTLRVPLDGCAHHCRVAEEGRHDKADEHQAQQAGREARLATEDAPRELHRNPCPLDCLHDHGEGTDHQDILGVKAGQGISVGYGACIPNDDQAQEHLGSVRCDGGGGHGA